MTLVILVDCNNQRLLVKIYFRYGRLRENSFSRDWYNKRKY